MRALIRRNIKQTTIPETVASGTNMTNDKWIFIWSTSWKNINKFGLDILLCSERHRCSLCPPCHTTTFCYLFWRSKLVRTASSRMSTEMTPWIWLAYLSITDHSTWQERQTWGEFSNACKRTKLSVPNKTSPSGVQHIGIHESGWPKKARYMPAEECRRPWRVCVRMWGNG